MHGGRSYPQGAISAFGESTQRVHWGFLTASGDASEHRTPRVHLGPNPRGSILPPSDRGRRLGRRPRSFLFRRGTGSREGLAGVPRPVHPNSELIKDERPADSAGSSADPAPQVGSGPSHAAPAPPRPPCRKSGCPWSTPGSRWRPRSTRKASSDRVLSESHPWRSPGTGRRAFGFAGVRRSSSVTPISRSSGRPAVASPRTSRRSATRMTRRSRRRRAAGRAAGR